MYRLLYTLENRGLIKYEESEQKYRLGFKFLEYSNALSSSLDIVKEAEDILTQLHHKTQQTTLLVILEGDHIVYVLKREKQVGLKYASSVGQRRPVSYGALGRSIMAFLPEEKISQLLDQGVPKLTPYTTTDRDQVIKQLNQIRKEKVYVEKNETTLGVTAIASPIFAASGEVMAAIGIVWPSIQLSTEDLEKVKGLVKEAGQEISARMGYGEPIK